MNLPARQQRILDQIEQVLQAADPRLKSAFAAFARRTSGQAMPATEAMPAPEPKPGLLLRRIVLVSVVLISVLSAVIFNVITTGNECPGLSSDQVVASAAVRYAACTHSVDAWSKGAR